MKLESINEYFIILQDLYYLHADIETVGDLYAKVSFFNSKKSESALKEFTLFMVKRSLEDNTHFFYQGDASNSLKYSLGNCNINEGIEFISSYWDELIEGIKKGENIFYKTLENGTIINISPYLHWTDAWKVELCQLTNIGYPNGWSHKCNKIPNYQYQMPNPLFIPDNDCGCEE